MDKKLRFAPLIRVSTEQQEEKGSSLDTQKEEILKAVEIVGGYVPDNCWIYSGQEHATPDFERKKFTQLLADASKDLFDAIIVYDPSRWSRDNRKSKEGLEILKQNRIKFFSGSTEYDLFNPQASLFLGMSTEMNEYFALEQARKSLINRIARAKDNKPSGGKLPFGRTFDKKTNQWGIDQEKQKKIVWAAEQYLQGKSMSEIAKMLGMNHPNLWKILKKRCGSEWTIAFNNQRLNISETVLLTIPTLLPQETIDAIHVKAERNKTYEHGHIKNKYLFSRMIFCSRCGYAMFGQTNHGKRRYYRHARDRKKACDKSLWVSADEIETAVFTQIYSLGGDSIRIEKAISKSIAGIEKGREIEEEIELLEGELGKVHQKKNNLINAIADGVLNSDDARNKMTVLNDQKEKLKNTMEKNRKKLENVPSINEIKSRTKMVQRVFENARRNHYSSAGYFLKMDWDDKRKLCELLFSGIDEDGNRAGVYIDKDEDGNWHYEVRGVIDCQIVGELPMSKLEMMELLDVDPDDVATQQDLFSKRDAHNCLSLHQ